MGNRKARTSSIKEERNPKELVTITSKDGWYYTNIGYRFHGEYYKNSNVFKTIWDLEKYDL